NGPANILEIPLKLNWKILKAGIAFERKNNWYLSLGVSPEVFWNCVASISVGYSVFDASAEDVNYADLKLALSREFLGFNWELSGTAVSRTPEDSRHDPRVAFTLLKNF